VEIGLESVLEDLLSCYTFFKESHASMMTVRTFFSTSVIKIIRDRNKPIHHTYLPFGINSREILTGKIQIMDYLLETLTKLDHFSADFVRVRYYELQSREFTIQYLKIGSVSTYKRLRHRVLKNCFTVLQTIESLDAFFPELRAIFHRDFNPSDQQTDEEGNKLSSAQ